MYHQFSKALWLGGVAISLTACAITKKRKPAPVTPPAASLKQDSAKPSANIIKKYKDFVTAKTLTQKGLFTVHQTDGKFYFELADSLLGRDMMVITRFHRTPSGAGNNGGEEITEEVLRFEKGPASNIFLRAISHINAADSTNAIYKAYLNSNLDPIVAAFDIKAIGKDSASTLIEVTDLFKGESPIFSLGAANKQAFALGAQATDRSWISSIRSYPINTEVRTVKTYNTSPSPSSMSRMPGVYAGAITMEFNNSFILLPKVPMRERLFDYRVGYFASEYNQYADDQQEVEGKAYIHRWRLEPREEDMEKWEKGELVEPKKPIVYYIDPATPKKWRSFLIAGINDWQVAFEKAGFKNAIIGKEWPEGDTTMSMEDARYSVVRYFASTTENAYGPNIADPRSGEIIESHIGWYHNVMRLVHDWYMIQAAAIDPRARKMVFDDALMGQLIRFVSSHEIGHTLGLRHNMGSSSRTPVELLRNKAWVEAHGHTASIMDYARFNYVAQPKDNISEKGIFPRIGDYDKWAIQWGYSPIYGTADAKADGKILNKWIIDSLKANPRLWFSGEGKDFDPRSQTEDLGDNSVKAAQYGIKNLQRIVPHLVEWTNTDGEGYTNLAHMYKKVLDQVDRYMGHALKYISGVYQTARSSEEPGDLFEATPKALQKEALSFICKNLFETPTWLLDKNILNKVSHPLITNGEALADMQKTMLMLVLSGGRMNRMNVAANRWGADKVLTPQELLQDVRTCVWSELAGKKPIDNFRRDLQKTYVSIIVSQLDPASVQGGIQALLVSMSASAIVNTDIKANAYEHLDSLRAQIKAAIPGYKNAQSREHLQYLIKEISKIIDNKK